MLQVLLEGERLVHGQEADASRTEGVEEALQRLTEIEEAASQG